MYMRPTVRNSFAVIETHRCPIEFGSSYSPRLLMVDQRMMRNAGVSELTRVNVCVNRLPLQVLESSNSPVVLLVSHLQK